MRQDAPLGNTPARSTRRRGKGSDRSRPPLSLRRHRGRLFGGVDFSGDMRDPRDATWMAILELVDDHLEVAHLEPTGRLGLEALLKDTEADLLRVEAIGLDFPFSLPLAFARDLVGGRRKPGWWDLARRFEGISRPAYLQAISRWAEEHGESKRLTDERAGAFSPLHRVNPDLGPMTYHGIRMIGKERSRHVLRPFEKAKGRLLFEVYPGGFVRQHRLGRGGASGGRQARILQGLGELATLPVKVHGVHRSRCLSQRDALDAVVAARCTAEAVLSGEADRSAEELGGEAAEAVKVEGWIYGLGAGPASTAADDAS